MWLVVLVIVESIVWKLCEFSLYLVDCGGVEKGCVRGGLRYVRGGVRVVIGLELFCFVYIKFVEI